MAKKECRYDFEQNKRNNLIFYGLPGEERESRDDLRWVGRCRQVGTVWVGGWADSKYDQGRWAGVVGRWAEMTLAHLFIFIAVVTAMPNINVINFEILYDLNM